MAEMNSKDVDAVVTKIHPANIEKSIKIKASINEFNYNLHNDVAFRRDADTAGSVHLPRTGTVHAKLGQEISVFLKHFDAIVPRVSLI